MASKYTSRGLLRLTRAERSAIVRESWKKRWKASGTKPKPKRQGKADPIRSAALKKAWRRRFRDGTATPKSKRVLLSAEQRSAAAHRAVATRRRNIKAAARKATVKAALRHQKKAAQVAFRSIAAPKTQPAQEGVSLAI